jgi:thiosulfate/3-mercaptopyruvate sulfurtransferase
MDLFLIEPGLLQQRLGRPDLVVIDCSWYSPEAGKCGLESFREGHIPSARFFDLDAASDKTSPYPNMLPPMEQFAEVAGSLGIDNDTEVIIYDASYVSARVWWMLRLFGHDRVRILNGGWRRWKAERRPVETGDTMPVAAAQFRAIEPAGQVADWRQVLGAVQSGEAQVVDARTTERFTGEFPSGYPGLPPGHIKGAINLPWSRMIRQSGDFGFETPDAAERIFREAGIDPERPIISTCGSGVTAAVLAFQLVRMGKERWKIYDGSWNEWGRRNDLPKESA